MTARIVNMLLALALLGTALGVVVAKHHSRMLLAQVAELERVRDEAGTEWGRLKLEQGTLAGPGRIERLARERLDMRLPVPEEVTVVRR